MANYDIFWGGVDVNPMLYKQPKHHTTQQPDLHRDADDVKQYQYNLKNNIPMVGICRGAQFLNVMNGGTLIQDVKSHGNDHQIIDLRNNEQFWVTSTHHQMMVPHPEAEIIAIDPREVDVLESPTSNSYVKQKGMEVVFYPKTACLCVQFHPEFMEEKDRAVQWVKQLAFDKLGIHLTWHNKISRYYGDW